MLVSLAAGCASGPSKTAAPGREPNAIGDDAATQLARLMVRLQDDILMAYERDDPSELDSGMIDP